MFIKGKWVRSWYDATGTLIRCKVGLVEPNRKAHRKLPIIWGLSQVVGLESPKNAVWNVGKSL